MTLRKQKTCGYNISLEKNKKIFKIKFYQNKLG